MSEINVNVCAALGNRQMSKHYEYLQQGDSEPNSISGKRVLGFPTRHISRKELFYNQKDQQQVSALQVLSTSEAQPQESASCSTGLNPPSSSPPMHPEEVEMAANHSDAFYQAKQLKALEPECGEEHIDVENCSVNGNNNGQVNGNGFNDADADGGANGLEEEEALTDSHMNGEEPPVPKTQTIQSKRSRQTSTSSHSSSISSVPSGKQQVSAGSAFHMDVSIDAELMEPLVMKGSAEDLEVSTNFAILDNAGLDNAEVSKEDEITEALDCPLEMNDMLPIVGDSEAQITVSDSKSPKSVEGGSQIKLKSPKAKKNKLYSHSLAADDLSEEVPISLDQEDPEEKTASVRIAKSPSRRTKISTSKQEQKKLDDKGDSDSGPRRSSRPRQTPQKYTASLFFDYSPDSPEERMNSSDSGFGAAVRTVRGRRSLRKSRNMSALDNSLHNDSSPWESGFKILAAPNDELCSPDSSQVEEGFESPAPGKRKADEIDEGDEQESKKACLEESALGSPSPTMSFFSVVTSPFILLKNKLQRRSLSCSTPIKIKENNGTYSDGDGDAEGLEGAPQSEIVEQVPDVQSSVRSWCAIM